MAKKPEKPAKPAAKTAAAKAKPAAAKAADKKTTPAAPAKGGKAAAKPVKGKAGAKGKAAKVAPKSITKSQLYLELANQTSLQRKQIADIFGKLTDLIKAQLGPGGPGVLTLPGLIKLKREHKDATEEKTVPSKFRPGEMMTIKAKPARDVIKVRPLRDLKNLIAPAQ